ncbi:hypothetical protein DMH04_18500 [Kibdelosporangium aridum]|uniref:Uncharacterized protein n=1 Tax=Kibdelosporangium aridum TaxID=2030 RepID=A0A428ZBD4_KIBAR|nr:hypothetical protein DMH04_18500 [Kibdelosporangium aridum]
MRHPGIPSQQLLLEEWLSVLIILGDRSTTAQQRLNLVQQLHPTSEIEIRLETALSPADEERISTALLALHEFAQPPVHRSPDRGRAAHRLADGSDWADPDGDPPTTRRHLWLRICAVR